MNEIIIAAIIVGAIGLLIGILLTIASEKFDIIVGGVAIPDVTG